MILAGDDAVLERLEAQDAPSQDLFPAVTGAASPSPASLPPIEHDFADPALGKLGTSILETGRDVVHELMQPGSGHMIESGFSAGLTRAREVDNMTADSLMLGRSYAPIMEALNKDRSGDDRLPNPWIGAEAQSYFRKRGHLQMGAQAARDMLEKEIWGRVEDLRRSNPGLAGNLPKDKDEMMADMMAEQRTALEWSDQARGGSTIGAVADFAGQMAGGMIDTPNILASVMGAPASASLLKTFVLEGGLNVALDAVGLPSRADRYKRLGHELSKGEIAAELAGDFVLGGALPTGAKAVTRAMTADAAPEVRAAARVVEDEGERAELNPHAGDAEGQDLTRASALQAMQAVDDGRPDLLPNTVASLDRALDPKLEAQRRRSGFTIESFDPAKVGTDAANMQYKGGGDAEGVTDRLQGVTEWDPVKAGLALVWERHDGSLVVADGHQRLGLAKRLAGEGQAGVNLYGSRFREVDGFTAQDMRVIAAYKNIAEGSGTGIDAARLLREAPEGVTSLPPRSPLVRQAKDLAALSDDAFGMTINGHASERDAALVGRYVHDRDLQAPILEHLSKDSPDTAEEAELFVRQALAAGASREVQNDMFGDFIKADLILPQRVKILKGALSSLRRDKALFATLTDKASAIQEAGNKLNMAENASRSETAAVAFATLKALAERKGKISDALQAAAETASRTGDRRAATAAFVKDVRAAISRGDLDREPAGGAIRDLEPETAHLDVLAQPQPDPALEHSLSLFGDPVEKPDAFLRQSQDIAQDLTLAAREVEFQRWFESSKVVDAQGSPLVVYHGTGADFKNFQGEDGFFFGNRELASEYALTADGNPNVVPVYLSIKNPARNTIAEEVDREVIARLKKRGYDGVIYNEGAPDAEYVAFEASQIKPLFDNVRFDASEKAAPPKPEFGTAQAEVDAIRRLDQTDMLPNPHGEGEISVRDARRMMEKEARAVEALRGCMGGDDAV